MGIALSLLKAPHVGIRELKEGLSNLLKKDKPLIITDHGEPTNVILNYNDFLEFVDIIEELNDPKILKLVAEGRKAIKEGIAGIPVLPAQAAKRK